MSHPGLRGMLDEGKNPASLEHDLDSVLKAGLV